MIRRARDGGSVDSLTCCPHADAYVCALFGGSIIRLRNAAQEVAAGILTLLVMLKPDDTRVQFEPALLASLPQHSGRSGKLDRSHPPPRA